MRFDDRSNFDFGQWLRIAARRLFGVVLLMASIGLSSCQALDAVDSRLIPGYKSILPELEKRSSLFDLATSHES